MKFHPANKLLSSFPNKIIGDEKWSYTVMGDKTYIRHASLAGTFECHYSDITNRLMPIGYVPPPCEADIEAFIIAKVQQEIV